MTLWICKAGHVSSVHRPEKRRCFFCGEPVSSMLAECYSFDERGNRDRHIIDLDELADHTVDPMCGCNPDSLGDTDEDTAWYHHRFAQHRRSRAGSDPQ